jgi:hypothetical protein
MQSVLTVHSLRRSHFGRDFLTGVKQTHSTLEYGIGANSDLTRPIGQGPVGSKRETKPIRVSAIDDCIAGMGSERLRSPESRRFP